MHQVVRRQGHRILDQFLVLDLLEDLRVWTWPRCHILTADLALMAFGSSLLHKVEKLTVQVVIGIKLEVGASELDSSDCSSTPNILVEEGRVPGGMVQVTGKQIQLESVNLPLVRHLAETSGQNVAVLRA